MPELPLLLEMRLVPWEYFPQGPFVVQCVSQRPIAGTTCQYDNLDQAVYGFMFNCLPWRRGITAFVLDSTGAAMCGYIATEKCLADLLGEPGWYGCAAGLAELEASGRIEPVNLAIWESTALRTSEQM